MSTAFHTLAYYLRCFARKSLVHIVYWFVVRRGRPGHLVGRGEVTKDIAYLFASNDSLENQFLVELNRLETLFEKVVLNMWTGVSLQQFYY